MTIINIMCVPIIPKSFLLLSVLLLFFPTPLCSGTDLQVNLHFLEFYVNAIIQYVFFKNLDSLI